MKCEAHSSEATAVCTYCGRALCPQCERATSPPRITCSEACADALAKADRAINLVLTKHIQVLESLHTTSTSSALYSSQSAFTAISSIHVCTLFIRWLRRAVSRLLHSDSRFTVSPRKASMQKRPNQAMQPIQRFVATTENIRTVIFKVLGRRV